MRSFKNVHHSLKPIMSRIKKYVAIYFLSSLTPRACAPRTSCVGVSYVDSLGSHRVRSFLGSSSICILTNQVSMPNYLYYKRSPFTFGQQIVVPRCLQQTQTQTSIDITQVPYGGTTFTDVIVHITPLVSLM